MTGMVTLPRDLVERALWLLEAYAEHDDIQHLAGIVDVPCALSAALAQAGQGEAAVTEPIAIGHIDPGFRFDPDAQQHIPTLLVELEPVSAAGGGDPKAKGWRDRDLLHKMLRSQLIAPAAPPPAPAVPEWVACSERMPEQDRDVLVYCSHGMYVAQWTEVDIEFWHVDDNKFGPFPLRGSAPTHWMPLPASPSAPPPPQQGETK